MACPSATHSLMARLVSSKRLAPQSVRSLAGFTVAGLGVGCYRMGHKHADVLAHVLQGAVNVIDTSTTYLGGESESMIGQVLASPTFCDRRKEMVVVTKVGYLQGPLLAEAAALEAQNRLWPEVAKFHPQAWHCMHPSFIRHQLEASRARLKGPADIVLLHNPEFFFTSVLGEGGSKGPKPPSEDDHRQFYERLEAAFVALEQAADEGALSCYGLSTNPKGCRWSCSGLDNIWEATDIDRIMAAADSAARSLGRQEHRCRVIQMPLNLLEPDALVGPVKVLEQCKQHGLDVMTHRPINAIPPPGFHVGDWARRESFIKLRDRRPQPPALALIAAVCRSVLPDDDLAGAGSCTLSDLALHAALSAPVSVALSGATQENYADKLHELLAQGPLSPHHVVEMMCKVDQLIKESGGD